MAIIYSKDLSEFEKLRFLLISWMEEPGGIPNLKVYVDSKGYATIGIGFLVSSHAELIIKSIFSGLSDQQVLQAANAIENITLENNRPRNFGSGEFGDRAAFEAIQAALKKVLGESSPEFQYDSDWSSASSQIKLTFDQAVLFEETKVIAFAGARLQNREHLALLSLAYNGMLGSRSPSLKRALADGDRAEAWFQIRYNSAPGKEPGVAKRRFFESSLFGLYADPSNPLKEEVLQAFRMLQLHRREIMAYEKLHGRWTDANGSVDGVIVARGRGNALTLVNGSDYAGVLAQLPNGRVETLLEALEPAKRMLFAELKLERYGLSPNDFLATAIYLDPGRANASSTTRTESHAAVLQATVLDTRSGREIASDDLLVGEGGIDKLYGGMGNDVLIGGAGDDMLFGGEGIDLYIFNADDGDDTIIDARNDGKGGDGLGRIFIGGMEARGQFVQSDSMNHPGRYVSADWVAEFTGRPGEKGSLILYRQGSSARVRIAEFSSGDFGMHLLTEQIAGVPSAEVSITEQERDWYMKKYLLATLRYTGRAEVHAVGEYGAAQGHGWIYGNDYINLLLDDDGDDFLDGGEGSDTLRASGGNDALLGGAGNDSMVAGDGDDFLDGGEGSDVISGGLGNDFMLGGAGNDFMLGGGEYGAILADWNFAVPDHPGGPFQADYLTGPFNLDGDGDDQMYGGDGIDYLYAGDGDDQVFGENGADVLYGNTGNDYLSGGSGDDQLSGDGESDPDNGTYAPYARHGNDVLSGGDGNDKLFGNGGSDQLSGDDGDDFLYGDSGLLPVAFHGDDWLDGGAGDDTLIGSGGNDILFGGAGNDELGGDSAEVPDNLNGDDYLDGGEGDDMLVGSGGIDTLFGGAGDDDLHGDASDVLIEFQLDDYLDGGDGDDLLNGYGGDDVLYGGAGTDFLYGFEGNDILRGGSGIDTMYGGSGDDTYYFSFGDSPVSPTDKVDSITEKSGNDRVVFEDLENASLLNIGMNFQENLLILWAGDDHLAISDGLLGAVESFEFADGSVLSCNELVGQRADGILFSSTPEGKLVLLGGFTDDHIETLTGNTFIAGGRGSDTLILRGKDYTLEFNQGDGRDTVLDLSTDDELLTPGDNTLRLGAGIDASVLRLEIEHSSRSLVLSLSGHGGDAIRFDRFDRDHLWNAQHHYAIEKFRFADGSELGFEDLLRKGVMIEGGNDDDFLSDTDADDLIDGGSGDDFLWGGRGADTYFWGAGAGKDKLNNGKHGGNGFGSISGISSISGTSSNQGLGNAHANKVANTDGSITVGAERNDRGDDSGISDMDTLRVVGVSTLNELRLLRDGDDLIVRVRKGSGQMTVMGHFKNSPVHRIVLDQGPAIDQAVILANIDNALSEDDDAWNGTDGDDPVDGGAGNDVLRGLGGNDSIQGNSGNDHLHGDAGDDVLDGGLGDDWLFGGDGNDTYVLALDSGNDTVETAQSAGNTSRGDRIRFGAGITAAQIRFDKVGTYGLPTSGYPADLLIRVLQPDGPEQTSASMLVRNYFTSADTVSGIERLEFDDGAVWQAADIRRYLVSGTAQDDVLSGGSGADLLSGLAGSDSLMGAGGDDVLDGGDGDDMLDGGSGNDVLRGDSGMDILFGGEGEDILDGGAGADILLGEGGNDRFLFGRGSGHDRLTDTIAPRQQDSIVLGPGISMEDVTLVRDGDDLLLVLGPDDQLRVSGFLADGNGGWYATDTAWQIRLVADDGRILSRADMLSRLYGGPGTRFSGTPGDDVFHFDGPDDTVFEQHGSGNDTIVRSVGGAALPDHVENLELEGFFDLDARGNALDNALTGNDGANLIAGYAGNDVLRGGHGNDLLYGMDGHDRFLYQRGDGQDSIVIDAHPTSSDVLEFGNTIDRDDVLVGRSGNHLELKFRNRTGPAEGEGAGDRILVLEYFNLSPGLRWFSVQFSDQVVWNEEDILSRLDHAIPSAGPAVETSRQKWGTGTQPGSPEAATADKALALQPAQPDRLPGAPADHLIHVPATHDPIADQWRLFEQAMRDFPATAPSSPVTQPHSPVRTAGWFSRLFGSLLGRPDKAANPAQAETAVHTMPDFLPVPIDPLKMWEAEWTQSLRAPGMGGQLLATSDAGSAAGHAAHYGAGSGLDMKLTPGLFKDSALHTASQSSRSEVIF